ncbi:hypothetical protein BGZ57DRAFT_774608, partial [Hyaloscypha finlandica]
AGSTSKSGLRIGTLYEGECGTVRHADSWLHIAINAMGTILLGANNFTMQCLTAPTRSEIDVAHCKGRYLDIGLPSLNTLNGWKRKVTFMFLVLSTLPLHFLWNSAVFTTTQNLDYNVFVVAPSFLNQSTADITQKVAILPSRSNMEPHATTQMNPAIVISGKPTSATSPKPSWPTPLQDTLPSQQRRVHQRLRPRKWQHERRVQDSNLLAVTKPSAALSHPNNTILVQFRYQEYVSNYTGNNWVCDPNFLIANKYKCNYKRMASNASSWNLGPVNANDENPFVLSPSEEWLIDYCLAQQTDLSGKCQLQCSLVIMISVLIANAIKLTCMIFILRPHLEPILATIGDGTASFLERLDPFNVDRPFLNREEARRFK